MTTVVQTLPPPPPATTPRLVTPNPEIQLSNVDDAKLVEALDAYDLDFGCEDDTPSMLAPGSLDNLFPIEELSKLSTLTEMVNALPEPPKKAEDIIAEALQSMSLEEREQIVRDLYGIEKAATSPGGGACCNDNDDGVKSGQPWNDVQFQEAKLDEMEQQIRKMKAAYGWNLRFAALEMAESQNLEYTQNKKFRLQFLKCDRFDAAKAASRFIRYFDWKLELFGEEALARDITFQDLTKEDQAMIKKGYLQRLPVRDRAGRSIFCSFWLGQKYDSPESMARQWFYLLNRVDDETASRGQIGIFFKTKDVSFKKTNRVFGGSLYIFRFVSEFPICFDAIHKFIEKEPGMIGKIMDFAMGLLTPNFQARTVLHCGNFNDWVTALMSFGIPHDVIPFTQSYKIKNKNNMEYLAMRIKAEELLATTPGMTRDKLVDLPTRRDVLLGKGRPIQFSSGNQALGMIVDGYLDQYHNQCNRSEKTLLANEIIRMVQSNGVRFLSKEHGIWMEVSHEVARDKLSHMFRHQKKKCNPNCTGTTRPAPDQTKSLEQQQQPTAAAQPHESCSKRARSDDPAHYEKATPSLCA